MKMYIESDRIYLGWDTQIVLQTWWGELVDDGEMWLNGEWMPRDRVWDQEKQLVQEPMDLWVLVARGEELILWYGS